jgi:hypothetical protein
VVPLLTVLEVGDALSTNDGLTGVTYVKPEDRVALVPSGFVTTTLTAPAACAGVFAEIDVAVTAVTVAAVPPIVTVAPDWKFCPVIVIAVPPTVVPELGETPVTCTTGATYVYAPLKVAVVLSGFVTVISTAPAACAGVFAEMDVAPTAVTVAAVPPILTDAPVWKF